MPGFPKECLRRVVVGLVARRLVGECVRDRATRATAGIHLPDSFEDVLANQCFILIGKVRDMFSRIDVFR